MKKFRIFALLLAVLVIVSSATLCVGAEEVTTAEGTEESTRLGDLDAEDLPSVADRMPYAVQGVVTGMLMVFSVLILLAVLISLSKYVFAPAQAKSSPAPVEKKSAPTPAPKASAPAPAPVLNSSDDRLIAVLTAAVAAMIDSSDEYRSEFASGFRVVSFRKVSENGAWNKK